MRVIVALVVAAFVTVSAAQGPPAPAQGSPVPGAPGSPGANVATPGTPPRSAPAPAGANAATGTRTATIRGRVTAADTGLPLRQAQIRITGFTPVPGVPPPLQATDAQGRFEFAAMPSGRVTITASKAGYVTLSQGQRNPREATRLVDVGDGQLVEGIDFVLPRGGAVTARVTDDLGGPLAGVRVQVEEYRFNAAQGGRVLSGAGAGQTDDRGEAFVNGLAPGEYYVSALAALLGGNPAIGVSDSNQRYAQPTYHPGVLSVAEAQKVTVRVGQTATVAFPMVVVRTARISGIVKTIEAAPRDLSLSVTQRFSSTSTLTSTTLRPDGSFEMLNAMPGQYTVSVRPATGRGAVPAGGEYGTQQFVVAGEDIAGIVITTSRAATIRGHYTFDGGASPPARPDLVELTLQGGFAPGTFAFKDDWTFELANAGGAGTLRVRPVGSTPSGWYLKSVRLASKDVTDTPTDFSGATDPKDLEIVLTQKKTDLTGSVTDARNTPVTGPAVVVFPEDRVLWTMQSRFIGVGRTDAQGQFRIPALPPGRYLAAAVDYLENGEERDIELLTRLETGAQRLSLAEGESKSLTLKVTTF